MTFLTIPSLPTVKFMGMWTVRIALAPHAEGIEGEDTVRWILAPALRDDENTIGIVGDLRLSNGSAVGGVTVFGPLSWDDEPTLDASEEEHWQFADALVARFAEWATDALYDHAAHVFNAIAVGTPYELEAPWSTPAHEVQTSEEATRRRVGG